MMIFLTITFVVLTALIYWLTGQASAFESLSNIEHWAMSGGVSVMLMYASLMLLGHEGGMRRGIRDVAIWVGLFFLLIAGYAYREEFHAVSQRVSQELLPPGHTVAINTTEGKSLSVRIRRRGDNHFQAFGKVNGQGLTFLVDTGASSVVLKPSDAQNAGIDLGSLSYSTPISTANGPAFAARIFLDNIQIGPIIFHNVEALIAKPGALNENLLGMSFLRRLRSYEFSKDYLILRT